MKKLIIIVLLVTGFNQSFAQSDPVVTNKKPLGGVVFYEGKKMLTNRQFTNLTSSNEEAYRKMKKANANLAAATVLGIVGGALIGFPLGTALGGGDPNWALAGAGAGLVLISFPFSLAHGQKAKEAVDIYNAGLNKEESNKVNFNLGISANGLGVTIGF